MKTIAVSLLSVLLTLGSSAWISRSNGLLKSRGLNDEKQAIMQLIDKESSAFWEKDFEAFASCWAHEDYIRTMGWWAAGGITVVEGWEERGGRTKKFMEDFPEKNPQNPVRKNINVRISEDMAWVTFDQYGSDTGDPTFDMPGLSRETRIVEKIDGAWKIVYTGWLLQGE